MKHELYNSGYRQHLFTTETKCASAAGQNHLFGISFAIVIRQNLFVLSIQYTLSLRLRDCLTGNARSFREMKTWDTALVSASVIIVDTRHSSSLACRLPWRISDDANSLVLVNQESAHLLTHCRTTSRSRGINMSKTA